MADTDPLLEPNITLVFESDCVQHFDRPTTWLPGGPALCASQDGGGAVALAISVFEDVLTDIADWEDTALSEAVQSAMEGLRSLRSSLPGRESTAQAGAAYTGDHVDMTAETNPVHRRPSLKRSIEQWRSCDPKAVCAQSPAAVLFAVEDARHDILTLADALAARDRPPATYTVQPGDSLAHIANQFLGSPLRWPELYELNVETIGPDENLIQPGQVLRLRAAGGSGPDHG